MRIFETFVDMLSAMRDEVLRGGTFARDPFGDGIGVVFRRLPWRAPADDTWFLGPAEAAMADDPYQAIILSGPSGLDRIARAANHGHEVWDPCNHCLASDVMES
jgi:hypothetical protein